MRFIIDLKWGIFCCAATVRNKWAARNPRKRLLVAADSSGTLLGSPRETVTGSETLWARRTRNRTAGQRSDSDSKGIGPPAVRRRFGGGAGGRRVRELEDDEDKSLSAALHRTAGPGPRYVGPAAGGSGSGRHGPGRLLSTR